MIAVDTNIIVRYLTADHAEQSPRARAIIDGQPVFVAVTVALETEWVLRSAYGYSRVVAANAIRAFLGLPTVTIEDADLVATSLDLAEDGMDFGDALHLVRTMQCDGFVTFDRKFVKAAQTAGYDLISEA
ncbi:type II toxin-antitoxin system VapC family toxin [uncultured Agrobacterium sp.]|uniref:type II toxin-antitoxin system VapC family toxin n=1 Tax=uncultured Agrobacterium sp. TaxID=157277 RepID=UPI002587A28B|nr:type II toxin-antitoxin system VapC family toxin [uncultured Agrobacterium sp.]